MPNSNENGTEKKQPARKPPHEDEARSIIQQYVDDLREVVKKLRRMLN
jgi:hypothetical protein